MKMDENPYYGVFLPVDASSASGDPYDVSGVGGLHGGFLTIGDPVDGAPSSERESIGRFEPRNWRINRLPQPDAKGRPDRRLAIQLIVDHDLPYEDGDAPFGQPESFDPANTSTRVVDTIGRVAIRPSHERIVGSEDDRYAIALTLNEVGIGAGGMDFPPKKPLGSVPIVPEGVNFRQAGRSGGITTTAPSVSVGGVTFFGSAAVKAAQDVISAGASDLFTIQAAASAAAQGRPILAGQDLNNLSGSTIAAAGAFGAQIGQQLQSVAPPPEPDRNPGGSVDAVNKPGGYVTNEDASRIGLLGTFFIPSGAQGSYFPGREGEPIGPLPARHDAQFHMGPDMTGRIMFVSEDASIATLGAKPFKGAMLKDASRANIDTELGLETCQWRPVVWIDMDIPPSPKGSPDTALDPGRPQTGGGGPPKDPLIPQPLPTGPIVPRPPSPGGAPGGGGGGDPEKKPPEEQIVQDPQNPKALCKADPGANSGKTFTPDKGESLRGGGLTPDTNPFGGAQPDTTAPGVPVEAPSSQARNFRARGQPCPNVTSTKPGGRGAPGVTPLPPADGGKKQIAIGGWIEQPIDEYFEPTTDGGTRERGPGDPVTGPVNGGDQPGGGGGGGAGATPAEVVNRIKTLAPNTPDNLRITVGILPPGAKPGFEFVETRTRVLSLEDQIGKLKGEIGAIEAEIKNVQAELDEKILDIEADRLSTTGRRESRKSYERQKAGKRIRRLERLRDRKNNRALKKAARLLEIQAWERANEAKTIGKQGFAGPQPIPVDPRTFQQGSEQISSEPTSRGRTYPNASYIIDVTEQGDEFGFLNTRSSDF